MCPWCVVIAYYGLGAWSAYDIANGIIDVVGAYSNECSTRKTRIGAIFFLALTVIDITPGNMGIKVYDVAKRGVSEFKGLEIRAQRELFHIDDSTLKAMQKYGFSAKDAKGNKLILHHHQQNPNGPIIEIPTKNHSIGNSRQHPFGNQKGKGLTAQQRQEFNQWRKMYWQNRATHELTRRGQ